MKAPDETPLVITDPQGVEKRMTWIELRHELHNAGKRSLMEFVNTYTLLRGGCSQLLDGRIVRLADACLKT